ncbi:MAG: glutamate--tRNA ligase [Rhodospirillaceae bacterium]|jgi:glutamyl-tRNA synthetase|nr:glutamate--tRNA ligase [Rhodospirillaceae bacterium]
MSSNIVTRFAPSPTGFLHIGSARTALFNWLFARHNIGGKFLLRIEDTDRNRSTNDAIDAIFDGLRWLELDWDDEPIFQFSNAKRHVEIAYQLLSKNKAYCCYCSPDELEVMRTNQRASGLPVRYDGRCRNNNRSSSIIAPVIRLKADRNNEVTIIQDKVQGEIRISNEQIDDMVLLRSDSTPTYMLSVVVDDHDMGITHVIRGDDHLTNTFRQIHIYHACDWNIPEFAHIPLIHGVDGNKLSKRHGAIGVTAYRDMGFLCEAMRNYILRLGWSHGNDEIISTEQAVTWFDLNNIGQSPSRFDMTKLINLNGHYLRQANNERLVTLISSKLSDLIGQKTLNYSQISVLNKAMTELKKRARTLVDLTENAIFYLRRVIPNELTLNLLDINSKEILKKFVEIIIEKQQQLNWQQDALEEKARLFCIENEIKLGQIAQPLRIVLTGSTVSQPIFEVMQILGQDECLARIKDALL